MLTIQSDPERTYGEDEPVQGVILRENGSTLRANPRALLVDGRNLVVMAPGPRSDWTKTKRRGIYCKLADGDIEALLAAGIRSAEPKTRFGKWTKGEFQVDTKTGKQLRRGLISPSGHYGIALAVVEEFADDDRKPYGCERGVTHLRSGRFAWHSSAAIPRLKAFAERLERELPELGPCDGTPEAMAPFKARYSAIVNGATGA